ncbi:ferredoxin--NADP reductase [Tsukamurella sp. 8F]|uniref:ferredoxin--NADP reductase n=1 Tax=unclassified Tsukamurella TaxID=2633480 RepID=UPI0023B8A71C|nr:MULTISPECIES: ferredoxin--NADP reductase [unclassified Tsukamurella]MDF0530708.1 ferredoxin--NADP reductase [Tsukamurella sp. 8J]MDF0587909.1 ferredoxin--NADP reductase [Tsukamurella sp. 8F]
MTVYRVQVGKVVAETEDAHSIEFVVPDEHREAFSYRPGQFLTVRVPSETTGSVARCYSLCAAPDEGVVRVAVKRTADGYASNWLCDNAAPGLEMDVLPPAGVFTPKSLDADLLLFAGGSGITPVMAIVEAVLSGGRGAVTLVYANRHAGSVIFAARLTELSRRSPDRLRVMHWLESVQGLPTEEQLASLVAPWREDAVYVCGPGAFMDTVVAAMGSLGVARRDVHMERFRSLPRNPFEAEDAESAEADALADAEPDVATPTETGAPGTLTVELDGAKRTLSWRRDRRLLDVLLDADLTAPYSCREGSCGACAARLVSGEVRMVENDVLEPEDIEDGLILACQALPVSDEVEIGYE